MTGAESEIEAYFEGRPRTRAEFDAVLAVIHRHAPDARLTAGSQISLGLARKFAWFWLYNVTKKDPNGVLHLMLALSEEVPDPHVRAVNQVGEHRWNHQIVIRSVEDARSPWLDVLVARACVYGVG